MTKRIGGRVGAGMINKPKRFHQISGRWKASAGGVNKKQARGNFSQECKEFLSQFLFHNQKQTEVRNTRYPGKYERAMGPY